MDSIHLKHRQIRDKRNIQKNKIKRRKLKVMARQKIVKEVRVKVVARFIKYKTSWKKVNFFKIIKGSYSKENLNLKKRNLV